MTRWKPNISFRCEINKYIGSYFLLNLRNLAAILLMIYMRHLYIIKSLYTNEYNHSLQLLSTLSILQWCTSYHGHKVYDEIICYYVIFY